jgi:hypothetical protein
MPGFLLHVGATVICAHGGQAQATVPNTRVTVTGQATVTLSGPYTIAGCSFPPPNAGNGPCVTAQWTSGTTRVKSLGQPLLVQSSQAVCAPTGTPVTVVVTQTRVTAQ